MPASRQQRDRRPANSNHEAQQNGTVRTEKRTAPDGVMYTQDDFFSYFGGLREWHAAATAKGSANKQQNKRDGGTAASAATGTASSNKHANNRSAAAANACTESPTAPAPAVAAGSSAGSSKDADGRTSSIAARAPASRGPPAVVDAWLAFRRLWTPTDDELAAAALLPPDELAANLDAQRDELTAVAAIYESELRVVGAAAAHDGAAAATAAAAAPVDVRPDALIEIRISLDAALEQRPVAHVRVPASLRHVLPRHSALPASAHDSTIADGVDDAAAAAEDAPPWPVDSLPPLLLRLRLPATYPTQCSSPVFALVPHPRAAPLHVEPPLPPPLPLLLLLLLLLRLLLLLLLLLLLRRRRRRWKLLLQQEA